jgi:geranylgeranyl diphosphate synthase, type II
MHLAFQPMANATCPSLGQPPAELRTQIDATLKRYIDLPNGCPARLREAMRYSLLAPGKRMRPVLVLLAAEACGGAVESAMPAAAAVEMVHAYSLIHDDLPAMDDDDLRRGRATCHKAFDEATAILAGDALLALAFEVLAKGVSPPATAAACCAALAEAAGPCWLVGGQADDMAGKLDGNGDVARLESIHSRKTGALICVSLRLGGLVAGTDQRRLAALEDYGRRLGLAFQITDDLLDVRGDEAVAGKRVGKDARQGKATFPGLLGVERSTAYAETLIAEACQALSPLGPRAAALEALAQSMLQRTA